MESPSFTIEEVEEEVEEDEEDEEDEEVEEVEEEDDGKEEAEAFPNVSRVLSFAVAVAAVAGNASIIGGGPRGRNKLSTANNAAAFIGSQKWPFLTCRLWLR